MAQELASLGLLSTIQQASPFVRPSSFASHRQQRLPVPRPTLAFGGGGGLPSIQQPQLSRQQQQQQPQQQQTQSPHTAGAAAAAAADYNFRDTVPNTEDRETYDALAAVSPSQPPPRGHRGKQPCGVCA